MEGETNMKILVATKETQGDRRNDFCWCEEGEIVEPSLIECGGETVDGRCGCRRSLCGLKTRLATTTFKVADVRLKVLELARMICESDRAAGFRGIEFEAHLITARELNRIASNFPMGAILERRGDRILLRKSPQ
jgi:hypothetical protein